MCWPGCETEKAMKAKIPKTDSISELARFFDTHKFADFEDQMEFVKGPLFAADEVEVKVRLSRSEFKKLHELAKARGLKPTDLVREWIREKIKAS
jgi:hypothetical protein